MNANSNPNLESKALCWSPRLNIISPYDVFLHTGSRASFAATQQERRRRPSQQSRRSFVRSATEESSQEDALQVSEKDPGAQTGVVGGDPGSERVEVVRPAPCRATDCLL